MTSKQYMQIIERVDVTKYMGGRTKDLIKLISQHCEKEGKPLVLTNTHCLPNWNTDLFNMENLLDLYGNQDIEIQGRDTEYEIHKKTISLGAYLDMLYRDNPPATVTTRITNTPGPSCSSSCTSLSTHTSTSSSSLSRQQSLEEQSVKNKQQRASSNTKSIIAVRSPVLPVTNNGDVVKGRPAKRSHSFNTESEADTVGGLDSPTKREKISATKKRSMSTVNPAPCVPSRSMSKSNSSNDNDSNDSNDNSNNNKVRNARKRKNTGTIPRKRSESVIGYLSTDSEEDNGESQSQLESQAKRQKRSPNTITPQGYNHAYSDSNETITFYAKDLDCPDLYKTELPRFVPPCLLPLGKHDLINCMPSSLQAANLMCYLGGTGSGTPLHRDISGAFGHNLMMFGDESSYADWLIIEKSESDKLHQAYEQRVSRLDKRILSSLDGEQTWISPQFLWSNGISAYSARQRPGDMVIIPSLCYHQVSNVGISYKIAWNRMTPNCLFEGIKKQLPINQLIARPEVYRLKATAYYTLKYILGNMATMTEELSSDDPSQFIQDCRLILQLYVNDVIKPELIESFPYHNTSKHKIVKDKKSSKDDEGFDVICDFCSGDIFHRYYHCDVCETDLCLGCYASGRTCAHPYNLQMHEFDRFGPAETDAAAGVETNKDTWSQTWLPDINASVRNFIKLYYDVGEKLNRVFGANTIDIECSSFAPSSDLFSLATICRRVEIHRKENTFLCNKVICGHCGIVVDLSDLWLYRKWDLKTIFGKRHCYLASQDFRSSVFVCISCSQKCIICHPITVMPVPEKKLVYFKPMTMLSRFWGGAADVDMLQSSSWPSYRINTEDDDLTLRKWYYPQDFSLLAASALLKKIKLTTWDLWLSENTVIMAVLEQVVDVWTEFYKTNFIDGGEVPVESVYALKPALDAHPLLLKSCKEYFITKGCTVIIPTRLEKGRVDTKCRPVGV